MRWPSLPEVVEVGALVQDREAHRRLGLAALEQLQRVDVLPSYQTSRLDRARREQAFFRSGKVLES